MWAARSPKPSRTPSQSINRQTYSYLVRRTHMLRPGSNLKSCFPPATVSKVFDPPEGKQPYSYVFDCTGDSTFERPNEASASPP